MFGLCAALVAQGYFKEVQLSFLIVGHTYEDIDQRFSIISNTLKRHDVDSLRQLLQLINEGASFTESFVNARLLENVWDWKSFITPYLMTGGDSFVGISLPHHMRFSMANGVARVQYKHYFPDQWGPAEGYECLARMPAHHGKPSLAPLKEVDSRELKALVDFIAYKERALQRLQYVERNIQAIEDTCWLQNYLKEFPLADRREAATGSFWPDEYAYVGIQIGDLEETQDPENRQHESDASRIEEVVNNQILALLPDPAPRGFFGPKKLRPSTVVVTKAPRRMNTKRASGIAQPSSVEEDPFPEFDPHKHVEIGHFVAMCVTYEDVLLGILFFLGKVIRFRGKIEEQGDMRVIWYWPEEKAGRRDRDGEFRNRYANCLNSAWVPTNEEHDWILLESGWVSWAHEPKTNRLGKSIVDMTMVHKISMEKEICIPHSVKPHLLELIAQQSDQWEDKCLQHDIE
jgi:hypothetical protein